MKLPQWLCERTPFFGEGLHGVGHPMRALARADVENVYVLTCPRCGEETVVDLRGGLG